MKQLIIIPAMCLAGWLVQSSTARVIWSEDFEGATVGATTMSGTVVQLANTASGIIVDSSTDPTAAAAFTLASDKFVRLSTGNNLYTAVRSVLNPISFSQISSTNSYTLSFDIFIPLALSTAVGDIQPRFELNGAGGNGPVDDRFETGSAGQHHLVYTGTISDFIGTDVNEVRPFIGIDQAGAVRSDYLYMDNIHFEIDGIIDPNPSPIDPAWFTNLRANRVESNPLVQWQHFGPGMSGYIDMFWINNSDPNAMYTSLDMGNGHVTLNGGEFWRSLRDSDGTGYHPDYFVAMDFSYTDPDFGLAVRRNADTSRGEVFQTTDRGASWQFLCEPIPGSNKRHNVISVDPGNDDYWYIGAGGGAFIKDAHYTKSGITNTSPWNTYMSEGFILYSKNRGASWMQVSSPFPSDSSFSAIIVDPRDSNKVYASCQYGVYKSTNGGVSWTLTPGGLHPRYMDSYYDPDANGSTGEFLLYIVEITEYDIIEGGSKDNIVTSGGVYRSADGGDTWDNLTGNLAIDLTQISIWAYKDKFRKAVLWWQDMNLGMSYNDFYSAYNVPDSTFSQFHMIGVDPTNKDRIYLVHNPKHEYAFPPGNIWMTENGGTNWVAAAREGTYWRDLASRPTDFNYWNSRPFQEWAPNIQMAHVDREHRENLDTYTGPRFLRVNQLGHAYTAFAQQIMRSTDNGESWLQVDDDETEPGNGHWVGRGNSNLPGETIYLKTGTPGTYLWGSGEHGLWRNTHDGDLVYPGAIAVEQLVGQSMDDNDPTSISTIAVDPNDTNKIYTLQFRQDKRNDLRYSPDGGISWVTLSEPFPDTDIRSHSLMVDHQNPGTLYFTIPFSKWQPYGGKGAFRGNGSADSSVYGIYKSTDGGLSWNVINSGIPAGSSIIDLAMDPEDAQVLYAALNRTHTGTDGGLYTSIDGGGSWSAMTVPAGITSVNHVMIHESTRAIYIACGNQEGSGVPGGGYVSHDAGASWTLIFDMPYVRSVDVCQANGNVMAVIVGQDVDVNDLNPGAYVTIDGAVTWHKINKRLGQSEKLNVLKVDPYDDTILWCCLSGTGFWKADISPLSTGVAKPFFWDWMDGHELADREGDSDGEGQSNRDEFITDTDPTNPLNYFAADITGDPSGGVAVGFSSAQSRLYTIEGADDLTGEWTVLTNGISGTGGGMELTDPAVASNRFYRVKAELE